MNPIEQKQTSRNRKPSPRSSRVHIRINTDTWTRSGNQSPPGATHSGPDSYHEVRTRSSSDAVKASQFLTHRFHLEAARTQNYICHGTTPPGTQRVGRPPVGSCFFNFGCRFASQFLLCKIPLKTIRFRWGGMPAIVFVAPCGYISTNERLFLEAGFNLFSTPFECPWSKFV